MMLIIPEIIHYHTLKKLHISLRIILTILPEGSISLLLLDLELIKFRGREIEIKSVREIGLEIGIDRDRALIISIMLS